MTPSQAFLCKIASAILNPAITLLALGATVLFIWGVVEFIRNGTDAEKRKTGQQHMLYGIVGLVIIFGARMIVSGLANMVGAGPILSC